MIYIKTEELKEVLKQALRDAHSNLMVGGGGIPIYADEEKVWAGGWLASNSWQPGLLEVVRVPGWHCSTYLEENYFTENWTEEDEMECQIDNFMLDEMLFKVERKQAEFEAYEQNEFKLI